MSWIGELMAAFVHIRPIEVEEPEPEPVQYPPDPAGTQTAPRYGNGCGTWSRILAQIEAAGGPVQPWTPEKPPEMATQPPGQVSEGNDTSVIHTEAHRRNEGAA